MKNIILALVVSLLIAGGLSAEEIPEYKTALSQYQQNKFEDSLNTIRSVFDNHRNSLDLRLLAAANYMAQGNYQSARDHLERAIKDHPKKIQPRALLSALHRKEGKANRALQVGRRAIRDVGDGIEIRLELASAYLQMSSFINAQNHLARARELDNKNFDATYLDGLAYLRQGKLENAEFRFRIALTLKPSSNIALANLYNNLGYTLEKIGDQDRIGGDAAGAKGRYTEAKKFYKLALKKANAHKQALVSLNRVEGLLSN